jgi:hypothetical protein
MYILLLSFLHRSQIAIAGIVDEHVDTSERALGFADGMFNLIWLRHIQSEHLRPFFMPDDEIVKPLRIARRCHYTKPMRQCRADKLPAEAS